MKAKYLYRVKDRYSDSVSMAYEYRGHEYMVTDQHNGCMDSLKDQHEYEQRRIDLAIEEAADQQTGKGFDLDEVFTWLEEEE